MLTDFLKLFKADPNNPAEENNTFNITTMLNENWDKIESFVKKLIGLQVITPTEGTVPNYIASLPGFQMIDGRRITIKFHAASSQVSTLKVNNEEAGGIKKPGGNDMTNIKAGTYTFVVDSGNFIVQGEGGEYGTATANKTLVGYTIGTENGIVEGTIPDKRGVALAQDARVSNLPGDPSDFGNGGTEISFYGRLGIRLAPENVGCFDTDTEIGQYIYGLNPAVVKDGQIIGGAGTTVRGTFTKDANALANQILASKIAYVKGQKVTGSMIDRSTGTYYPTATYAGSGFLSIPIPADAYYGTAAILAPSDPDYVSGNFLDTADVFGLKGTIKTHRVAANTHHTQAVQVAGTSTPGRLYMMPENGHWDGASAWIYFDDPNYLAAKIPKDISLFGLTGTRNILKSAKITPALSTAAVNSQNVRTKVFSIPISGLTFNPVFVTFSLSANMAAYGQYVGGRAISLLNTTDNTNFSGYSASIDITSYNFVFELLVINVVNGGCTLEVYLTCNSPNNALGSPNGVIQIFGY